MGLTRVQRSELTDRLRRFFGLVGGYESQLETVLNPVVLVQDLEQPPYRQSTTGFMAGATQAAVVGSRNLALIENPVSGPPAVVIDELRVSSATAGAIYVVVGSAGYPGLTPTDTFSTDRINRSTAGVFSRTILAPRLYLGATGAGPFTTEAIGVITVTAGVERVLRWPLVIRPGAAAGVWCDAANVTLGANFCGRVFSDPSLLAQLP